MYQTSISFKNESEINNFLETKQNLAQINPYQKKLRKIGIFVCKKSDPKCNKETIPVDYH